MLPKCLFAKVGALLGRTPRTEHRQHPRAKAAMKVTIQESAESGEFETLSVDASPAGMGLISRRKFRAGHRVLIRLKELDLVTFASVRRCEARPDGTFRLGLQFLDKLRRERMNVGESSYRLVPYGSYEVWDASTDFMLKAS